MGDAVVCTPNAMTFNMGCDQAQRTVTKLCLNQTVLVLGKRDKCLICKYINTQECTSNPNASQVQILPAQPIKQGLADGGPFVFSGL
jgi:hypothetical protein